MRLSLGATPFPRRRILPAAFLVCALLAVFAMPSPGRAQTCDQESFLTRPIPLGVSGGNFNSIGQGFCCSGTIGALVQDSAGKQYVLSNNHVLGRTNRGRPGELIVQPGLVDDPDCSQNSGDEVAALSASVPILFGGRNLVDAAIAQIAPGAVDTSGQILNIGPIAGTIDLSPLGADVQKMGRTTCVQAGMVSAVNVAVLVGYPKICNEGGGTALFTNQLLITPGSFSAAGDSGSLVVTRESCPRAIGLLFAGSATVTFANPIAPVLAKFRVEMVGGCTPTSVKTIPQGPLPSSPPGSPKPFNHDVVEALERLLDRHTHKLLKIRGVVGTGVGISESTGQPQLEIYVRRDSPKFRARLPASIEGEPTSVREIGDVVAY